MSDPIKATINIRLNEEDKNKINQYVKDNDLNITSFICDTVMSKINGTVDTIPTSDVEKKEGKKSTKNNLFAIESAQKSAETMIKAVEKTIENGAENMTSLHIQAKEIRDVLNSIKEISEINKKDRESANYHLETFMQYARKEVKELKHDLFKFICKVYSLGFMTIVITLAISFILRA